MTGNKVKTFKKMNYLLLEFYTHVHMNIMKVIRKNYYIHNNVDIITWPLSVYSCYLPPKKCTNVTILYIVRYT